MQWFVDLEKTVRSVDSQTVRVLMTHNGAYRDNEVKMPLHVDINTYVSSIDLQALWATGRTVPIGSFFAARERNYREYYYMILQSIEVTRQAGGDLDAIRAAGLQAIGADSSKATEFASWRAMLQLNGTELTMEEKRLLLMGMLLFANTGLNSGR